MAEFQLGQDILNRVKMHAEQADLKVTFDDGYVGVLYIVFTDTKNNEVRLRISEVGGYR